MPEQSSKQFQKRLPSKQVSVNELNKDIQRVSLIGTILSRNDKIFSFLLDDGTGTVNIIMNDADRFENLKDGKIVRVFGKIWGEGEDIEVQGDLVQDFSKLDFNLFKKAFSIS